MSRKHHADVINAVKDVSKQLQTVEERITDLEADISKVKNEVTAKQPKSKFKVAKTKAHPKTGELITVAHNETSEKVKDAIKEKGSVSTPEMERLLRKYNVDVSRPIVRDIMRRYASEFNYFRLLEPKKKVRRSYHLRYTP